MSTPSPLRFIQIEVSTVCNFRCFYCIGRTWTPRHMDMALFQSILHGLQPGARTVSLQGEGEPLAHPQFWTMAGLVKEAGLTPYTITNGSLVDPARMAGLFPIIGFSLDTVDPDFAERIGRRDLPNVLSRLEALCDAMGPERIIIHTVHFGQDLAALKQYLQRRGLVRHVVQPLQGKSDYRARYPKWQPKAAAPERSGPCRHLARPFMRFYDVEGRDYPCCYIKSSAHYRSDSELLDELEARRIPQACTGCRAIGSGVQDASSSLTAD
ncbi:radical SAM protein [Oceanidesulfovibrio marinus]|uniref:Radical SAM protein n=1 Tax=Oceanidesulfovibrio marinus TaxID=370038 RepID=A0ABX6NBP3_9BACT|nr:radical SAM protein [Oceanidesulfovibrio marinus]QJT08009.1 radical SAM protein [Oceanidesulfovibrio marinus]